MSAYRIILVVLASVGILIALAVLSAGGLLLWADRAERDDGYLTTPSERFETPTYALTRTRLEVDGEGPDWVWNDSWFGKIRIRGESAVAGKPLFIGVGPAGAVGRYLGRVAHSEVEDIDLDPFRVTYRRLGGAAPRQPPTAQDFWAASVSGAGRQTLTWKVRDGNWSVVLMNVDGSRPVAADLDLGAKLSFLIWVAIGVLIGGALLLGGSIALAVLAAREPRPPPPAPAAGPPTTS